MTNVRWLVQILISRHNETLFTTDNSRANYFQLLFLQNIFAVVVSETELRGRRGRWLQCAVMSGAVHPVSVRAPLTTLMSPLSLHLAPCHSRKIFCNKQAGSLWPASFYVRISRHYAIMLLGWGQCFIINTAIIVHAKYYFSMTTVLTNLARVCQLSINICELVLGDAFACYNLASNVIYLLISF